MESNYDVIVVGGGHAGVEASLISQKMGMKVLLLTLNIKMISNMPCNPSIGGSAKGIVVREVDSLGGIMGIAADHNYLQMKMLNTGKGPGVQCLRAQADKIYYPRYIQNIITHTSNLDVKEEMVVSLLHDEKTVFGVTTNLGNIYHSKAVILTTGTFMESELLVGHSKVSGGPDGEPPSLGLSPYLKGMGLDLLRLKTGTPQRIDKDTIDYSKGVIQNGSKGDYAFSYSTKEFIPVEKQIPCWLIYTTPETHKIIKDNLKESAMYSGLVKGVGPRYCPSIEDKIVRFADKPRHQLFLEPESIDKNTIYLQGFSTSMPHNVQDLMVHSLPGLEHAKILKYAYAIEYDAIEPLQFLPTLELKKFSGLYGAGQICGTSGYEEAAGLGIMAGINACLKIKGEPPFILRRDEAYIGVMIDDLVTKGTKEPYRLLSSRAEYRLLMRHDNADLRLTSYAIKFGTLSAERIDYFNSKNEVIKDTLSVLKKVKVCHEEKINTYLLSLGYEKLSYGISCEELLKRPVVSLEGLLNTIDGLSSLSLDETTKEQVEVMVKYDGYIAKEKKDAMHLIKQEETLLDPDIDYLHMDGLALEARQKFDKIRPLNIGQASRISGVNPSDISILLLNIKKGKIK